MVDYSQISEKLAAYLNGKADLNSFEDWIALSTWNIHQAKDSKAEELTFAIEESLSEHSSGHISEVQMKNELRAVLLASESAIELLIDLLPPRRYVSSLQGHLFRQKVAAI